MKGLGWIVLAAVAAYVVLVPKGKAGTVKSPSSPSSPEGLAGQIGTVIDGAIRLFDRREPAVTEQGDIGQFPG